MKKIRLSKLAIFLYIFSVSFMVSKVFINVFLFKRGSILYSAFYRSGNIFFLIFLPLLFFLIFFKKLKININFSIFTLLIFLISLISYLINSYSLMAFLLGLVVVVRPYFYSFFFSSFKYMDEDIKRFLNFVIFLTLLIAVLGVIEYFSLRALNYKIPFLFTSRDFAPRKDYFFFPRISVFFDHSNKMANFELFGFNILLSLIFLTNKKKYFFYILPVIGVIFFSYSRQAFIAILISVILILIVIRSKKILLFLASSMAIFFISKPELILDKFLDFFLRFQSGFVGKTFYFRMHALKSSLMVLRDNFFFGVGPGRFGSPITKVIPSVVEKKYELFSGPFRYLNTMDMFFPTVWAEVGILGFSTLLIFYFFIAFLSFKNFKFFKGKDNLLSALNLGVFLEIFSVLFIGFVSYSVNTIVFTIFFFSGVGIILRYSYEKRKSFTT